MDRAIAEAVERAGVDRYSLVSYPSSRSLLDRLADVGMERYIEARLRTSFDGYFQSVSWLRRLKEADRLQARLPFEGVIE